MAVQNPVRPGETIMVIGAGVMGLSAIAALKALYPETRLIAVEPSPFNQEMARRMGADEIVSPPMDKKFYRRVAEMTDAKMFTPMMTPPLLIGGPERIFDTVGTTETINTGLRLLANGGWFNLLGIGNPKKIDWTPVWFKELTIKGVYGYQEHLFEGRTEHNFEMALRLHAEGKVDLTPLVTHKFSIDQYPEALEVALDKGKHNAIKIAFQP